MRRVRLRSCLAALALLSCATGAATAAAPALVDATDPALIAELMRGYGSARLDTAEDGTPMVRGRIDGDGFTLFFYDCDDDGKACQSVGFSSFFDKAGVPAEAVSGWNAASRFGRAYLRDDGKPVLEMDVQLGGGVTADNFEGWLDRWAEILQDFGEGVVNRAGAGIERP